MAGFMLAIATSSPCGSRTSALKSRPSLKIGEYDVRISALAISSQTFTSWACSSFSSTGSTMQHQASALVDVSVPARRHEGGGVHLLDHRGPDHALAGHQDVAPVDRRVGPAVDE